MTGTFARIARSSELATNRPPTITAWIFVVFRMSSSGSASRSTRSACLPGSTVPVKNVYRVLVSRGLKGCYVHFLDKDTERFFKTRMGEPPKDKVLRVAEPGPRFDRDEGGD